MGQLLPFIISLPFLVLLNVQQAYYSVRIRANLEEIIRSFSILFRLAP